MLKKKTADTLLGKRLRDSLRHPSELGVFKWLFYKQVDRFNRERQSEPINSDEFIKDAINRSMQPAQEAWKCFSPTRVKQHVQEEYVYTETGIHVVFNEVYGDNTHERPSRVAFRVVEPDQLPQRGLFPNTPPHNEFDFDLKSTLSYETTNLVDFTDEETDARSNILRQKRREKKRDRTPPRFETVDFGQTQDGPAKLFEKTQIDAKPLLESQQDSTYCSFIQAVCYEDSIPLEKTQSQSDAEELESIAREVHKCAQRLIEPGVVFNFQKNSLLALQQHLANSDGKTKLTANEIYARFQLLMKEKEDAKIMNKTTFFKQQAGPKKRGAKRGPGRHNISTTCPDNPQLVPKKGETQAQYVERFLGHVENEKLQLELSKQMQLEEFVVQKRLEAIEIQVENYLDTSYKYYPPEEDIELIKRYGEDELKELLRDSQFKEICQQKCIQKDRSFEGTTNIKALELVLLQHLQSVTKKRIQQQAKRVLQREISSSLQDENYQLSPLLTGKACKMRVFGKFNVTFKLQSYSISRPSNAFSDVMQTVSWFEHMFNTVQNMVAPHRLAATPCQLCMHQDDLNALMSLAQQGIAGFEEATRQAKVHLRKLELLYYDNYDTIEKPLVYYDEKADPPVKRFHLYRQLEGLLQYEEPLYGGVNSVTELNAAFNEEKSKTFASGKDKHLSQKPADKQHYQPEDIRRMTAKSIQLWDATYKALAR